MAHFAKLDENNVVLEVNVIDNKNLLDSNGIEQEEVGVAFLVQWSGGYTNWNALLVQYRPVRSADRAKMPHSLGGSCSDSRCTWGTSSYVCPCWCLPCGRVGSN